MITKRFQAPIGAGLRQLVIAPLARKVSAERGVAITVIANKLMQQNWKGKFANADFITPEMWLRRAQDADNGLIIVEEGSRLNRIGATLESIKTEVWLINPPSMDFHIHPAVTDEHLIALGGDYPALTAKAGA